HLVEGELARTARSGVELLRSQGEQLVEIALRVGLVDALDLAARPVRKAHPRHPLARLLVPANADPSHARPSDVAAGRKATLDLATSPGFPRRTRSVSP